SEGSLEKLVADLVTHELDLVLADAPVPPSLHVKAFNHLLGECGIAFFASSTLSKKMAGEFPRNLHGMPLLLPMRRSNLRVNLEEWLAREDIFPRIVGEFDDSALMSAFGEGGSGVFAAPSLLEDEFIAARKARVIGRTEAVRQTFYAISIDRKI